jgi:hypothetical protein
MSKLPHYPNVFLKGPSGSGKDFSMRNLPAASTVMINTEDKALPFKRTFPVTAVKNASPITFMSTFMALLEKCIAQPSVEVIIINSFTSFCERVQLEGSLTYEGFDVYSYYAKSVAEALRKTKNVPGKIIIWTGIDDVIVGDSGIQRNCIKVQGKVWYGSVEKEFTCVLQAHVGLKDQLPEYVFITNRCAGFVNSDIKSPPGLLPERMDNDMNIVVNAIKDFYREDDAVAPAATSTAEQAAPVEAQTTA